MVTVPMTVAVRRPRPPSTRRRRQPSTFIPTGCSLERRLQSLVLATAEDKVIAILSKIPGQQPPFKRKHFTPIHSPSPPAKKQCINSKHTQRDYLSSVSTELSTPRRLLPNHPSPLETPTATNFISFTPTATPSFKSTPSSVNRRDSFCQEEINANGDNGDQKLQITQKSHDCEQDRNSDKSVTLHHNVDAVDFQYTSQTSDGLEMLLVASQTASLSDDVVTGSPQKD